MFVETIRLALQGPLIGATLPQAEIGIIGGSGLYSMPGFSNVHEERVETPFGDPSDPFVLGELEGRKVAFLARHGRGHRILPSELNFRANIYAFKKLGVERIISVSVQCRRRSTGLRSDAGAFGARAVIAQQCLGEEPSAVLSLAPYSDVRLHDNLPCFCCVTQQRRATA